MEIIALYSAGTKTKHAKYLFQCPVCGKEVISSLRDGKQAKQCKKCYCTSFSGEGNPNHRHGGRTVFKNLWNVWSGMKQRCQNKKNPKYYRYGGRGICVCAAWQEFADFKLWADSHGWEDGLSIDRIDVDGNYCPENCRFITVAENSKYKSTTKISDEKADIVRRVCSSGASRKDIAELLDVSSSTITSIISGKTHNTINPA